MNNQNTQNFSQLVGDYINWLGVSRSIATKQSYNDALRRFKTWSDKKCLKPQHTTVMDINRYLISLNNGKISSSTRFHYTTALRAFWRWSHEQKIVSFPETLIPLPAYEKVRRDHLLPVEFDKMMGLLDEHFPKRLRNKCILSFLYDTGVRLGELLAIDAGDLDMDRRQCIVKTFKRKNHRRPVFWTERTHNLLAKWLEVRRVYIANMTVDDKPLWISFNSVNPAQRLERTAVQRMFRELRKAAHIERQVSAHSCRHGLATELVKSAMPITYVKEILGHASLNSTMIYTHLDATDIRNEYQKRRIATS